jgi:hypothetical protein
MATRLRGVLGLLVGFAMAGCQCCECTERLADLTDRISSRECAAEVFYHPGLDLTRIGRRDWCECPINHWLCPCRCDRYCQGTCP